MLILPLKPGVRYDLGSALATWLDRDDCQTRFSPKNPLEFVLPKPDFSSTDVSTDLMRLQSLRTALTEALLKPGSHKAALEEGVLADCHEYHATLLEFEKRGFPVVDDAEGTHVQLVWKGAFDASSSERHATLVWDRAATLYNVAALLTQQAADCSVSDRQACKTRVGLLQQAAGLLGVLKEMVPSQDFATVDLSLPLLSFWQSYCLAEAQLAIYRMASLAATQNHSTLSMLSQSVFTLFSQALTDSQDARLNSEIPAAPSDWAPYCKAQSMMGAAKAEYHDAVVHRLASAWGLELARLKQCHTKLVALHAFLETLPRDSVTSYIARETAAILPVVADRFEEADQDNYKIYQDFGKKELPEMVGKQLAKGGEGLPVSMLVPSQALFANVSR